MQDAVGNYLADSRGSAKGNHFNALVAIEQLVAKLDVKASLLSLRNEHLIRFTI